MFEFRVTKYDPSLRDAEGRYTVLEWSSSGDIGRSFPSGSLSREAYERVESAYCEAAIAYLTEAGLHSLIVTGLEIYSRVPLSFGDSSSVSLGEAGGIIRRLLREEFWCRLESVDGFVHVGYDFYLYVGVHRPCPQAEARSRQLGLFVESYRSPYHHGDVS